MIGAEARRTVSEFVRSYSSIHRPDGRPNIFLFTTPRSGSTWLLEVLATQPGFKACSAPEDIRNPSVRKHLGISDWISLYARDSEPLLQRYFQGLCNGRIRFMNPRPSFRHFRPITRRIVFKILNCGEDRISWFRDTFNGKVVLLLRHPIPVSLSREVYPRLEAFMTSDYRRHFTTEQLSFARRVADSGSKLERGVLDWCFQNAVPLWQAEPDWIVATYEELLLEPRPVIERFASDLDLPDPGRMLANLVVPSRSVYKSSRETASVLDEPPSARRTTWLLRKWCDKVSREEEARAMDILKRFHIDAYSAGEVLPTGRFAIPAGALPRPAAEPAPR